MIIRYLLKNTGRQTASKTTTSKLVETICEDDAEINTSSQADKQAHEIGLVKYSRE
jgi:exopolysaccharide biosynthesis protein